MNKWLRQSLLVTLLAVAGLTTTTMPAAGADLRTITVELANGRVVEVVREVTKGTPLEKLLPPGSEPIEDQPTDDEDGGNGGNGRGIDPDALEPDKDRDGAKDGEDETAPEAPEPQPLVDPFEAPDKKRKPEPKEPKLSPSFRDPDGRPSRDNPTVTDVPDPADAFDGASPGKAVDGLPVPTTSRSVPNFVIDKFQVPIFLLPIYQAAGTQYGIRWEILAAINEIETDYGRNLNVSSAGAMGWMQFLPSSWRAYGVDGNRDGKKDPYNPVDAIFAAARYLKAAGYDENVRDAIFSYNHADWYVDSVMMRAKLIAGVPADLTGSLTGLTEGRFPVYAKAQYADDLSEREATHRVEPGENAANVQESDPSRRQIQIFSEDGAPVIAVNDGEIVDVGEDKRLGKYVVLEDAYGNQFTYAGLGELSKFYPVAEHQGAPDRTDVEALTANDPAPDEAASKGRQERDRGAGAKGGAGKDQAAEDADAPVGEAAAGSERNPSKERLFAHPDRPNARRAGGIEQIVNSGGVGSFEGFSRYNKFAESGFGLKGGDNRLERLEKGAKVTGGTLLGRVGEPTEGKAAHVNFAIRPSGRGAPRIDPKPILDGWKLLEQTAIYRANGKNVLQGGTGVGQVLLMSKPLLERRVLADKRIEIYECGRQDIQTGRIDRRVLAVLAYLAESGLRPTVTSLICGHGKTTSSGNVSNHWYGGAVDIAAINGVPILGHQDKGGVTDQAVRRVLQLQGTMRPNELISLLDYGAPSFAMGDHADHIHVGYSPSYGFTKELAKDSLAVLEPDQWSRLTDRLGEIPQPKIKQGKGDEVLPAKKGRASEAHRGD